MSCRRLSDAELERRNTQRRAGRPVRPPAAPVTWRESNDGFGLELSSSPYLCTTETTKSRDSFRDTATGLEVGLGLRYRFNYRRARGLFSPWVFLGNQLGADLRLRIGHQHRTRDGSSSASVSLDLVPMLRVGSPSGRLRFPSLLSLFVPTVGVQHVRDRPLHWRVKVLNPSVGYLLNEWILLEAELGLLLRLGGEDEGVARMGLDAQLRLVMVL